MRHIAISNYTAYTTTPDKELADRMGKLGLPLRGETRHEAAVSWESGLLFRRKHERRAFGTGTYLLTWHWHDTGERIYDRRITDLLDGAASRNEHEESKKRYQRTAQ